MKMNNSQFMKKLNLLKNSRNKSNKILYQPLNQQAKNKGLQININRLKKCFKMQKIYMIPTKVREIQDSSKFRKIRLTMKISIQNKNPRKALNHSLKK